MRGNIQRTGSSLQGSRAQVVGRWERRSWETSVSVRGENEGRRGEDREGGRVGGREGG